jgi:hypothetical protein
MSTPAKFIGDEDSAGALRRRNIRRRAKGKKAKIRAVQNASRVGAIYQAYEALQLLNERSGHDRQEAR